MILKYNEINHSLAFVYMLNIFCHFEEVIVTVNASTYEIITKINIYHMYFNNLMYNIERMNWYNVIYKCFVKYLHVCILLTCAIDLLKAIL